MQWKRFTRRPSAPFGPIYIAGYIQDQFSFKDLTFNVRVRVDRIDMNQSVLKDPCILYPFYTVSEIANSNTGLAEQVNNVPGNIGGDYRVHVSSYENNYENASIVRLS
ncbi:MAG: hypothetical protein U5L96_15415 [Owenweeksia sp.]|nr:hypothetical protein [Owenweeksia sp.]